MGFSHSCSYRTLGELLPHKEGRYCRCWRTCQSIDVYLVIMNAAFAGLDRCHPCHSTNDESENKKRKPLDAGDDADSMEHELMGALGCDKESAGHASLALQVIPCLHVIPNKQ